MNDEPTPVRVSRLRAQLLELGAAVRHLNQAGLDSEATQLKLARKRAEPEDAVMRGGCDVS